MKITIIGGGPGGLYFALLTKKARPHWHIEVHEQNRADDTFGFGVVFSEETLQEFLGSDAESFTAIKDIFAYWDDIVIHYRGTEIRCGGNGFAGCSRLALLNILQRRCADLGVALHFESPVADLSRFADFDVIVAADGINSRVRETFKEHFQPALQHKANKFTWLGSTRPLDAFTFFFKQTEHGLICAHTYQYEERHSTWVIEMSPSTWDAYGFELLNERDSADLVNGFSRMSSKGIRLSRTGPYGAAFRESSASNGGTTISSFSGTRRQPHIFRSAPAPSWQWSRLSHCRMP
jgi:anthraniloyl-CoA monooxygenase